MTFCPSSKTSIPPFFWIAITRFSTLPRLTGADALLFWKCTHFVCGPCTMAHYISVPLEFNKSIIVQRASYWSALLGHTTPVYADVRTSDVANVFEQAYWKDPRAVETNSVWARMYMATNQLERAVSKSIDASMGFFSASKEDSDSQTRGLQHLSDGICMLRQLG